jgi:hypothetical protein
MKELLNKKSKAPIIETMEKQKKVISWIFIVLLVVQVLLFDNVTNLGREFNNTTGLITSTNTALAQDFVANSVRGQERIQLNAIRQGWVQYLVAHQGIELLLKDKAGLYIFADKTGKTVSYNPETMYKDKTLDNYFILKDKLTGTVLLNNCRQQWNKDEVKKILDIVATPVKAFGTTGDVIIFDSFTGEMIIDNSENCKDTPEVLGEDGKRYITLDYIHPNNKNPDATKRVVANELMWRSDSNPTTGMVYYFNEPIDMGTDANNFTKYPLGNYNREFQEKIILPYESVGIDGQPMQITIVLGAQEQEIITAFKATMKSFESVQKSLNKNIQEGVMFPLISIGVSLLVLA